MYFRAEVFLDLMSPSLGGGQRLGGAGLWTGASIRHHREAGEGGGGGVLDHGAEASLGRLNRELIMTNTLWSDSVPT